MPLTAAQRRARWRLKNPARHAAQQQAYRARVKARKEKGK